MEFEKTIVEHAERIATAEKGISVIEKQIPVLFKKVDDVKDIASENHILAMSIDSKIENGIRKEIRELAASFKEMKAIICPPINLEKEGEAIEAVREEVRNLKADSWFLKILNMSIKKFLSILIIGILSIGAAIVFGNTQAWKYTKISTFKEAPGLVEMIAKMQLDDGYRPHTLPDGTLIFHCGDADSPAFKLNMKTGKWEKVPGLRTEDAIKSAGGK